MARMMPPLCPKAAPPGERAVFEALATSPATHKWVVLHSLCIADHVRQVQGEADFVVLVPHHGIAVVEVKSHLKVERLPDGSWKLGDHRPTSRSPFQQADEAMHSVRQYLHKRHIDIRSIPIVSGVWFTHTRARAALPESPEWHGWQLLDRLDLANSPANGVLRLLDRGRDHLSQQLGGMRGDAQAPDEQAVKTVAATLRPRFETAMAQADVQQERVSQLRSFLDEQYDALDAMAGNRAVLFSGPAGSGKTFLASEAARREVALGGRGRLVCFNRLLGRALARELRDVSGLHVSTFHQEVLRLSALRPPKRPTPAFWEADVVDAALERLLEQDHTGDFLIVDEFQDLSRPGYLDVFEMFVSGGLSTGRVLLFGDFERQAIYGMGDGRERIHARVPALATHNLTVNCRNLPRIGTIVQTLSNMLPGYRRFRRADDGIDPKFLIYERGRDQSQKLAEAIQEMRGDGYQLEDIVVLSPRRSGAAAELTRDSWLRQVLVPENGSPPQRGRVRYTTIHAFKGLDAPAVILTDLDDEQSPAFDALLYVGLTRATDRLTVIADARVLRSKLGGRT